MNKQVGQKRLNRAPQQCDARPEPDWTSLSQGLGMFQGMSTADMSSLLRMCLRSLQARPALWEMIYNNSGCDTTCHMQIMPGLAGQGTCHSHLQQGTSHDAW